MPNKADFHVSQWASLATDGRDLPFHARSSSRRFDLRSQSPASYEDGELSDAHPGEAGPVDTSAGSTSGSCFNPQHAGICAHDLHRRERPRPQPSVQKAPDVITGHQLAAARVLLGMTQRRDLAMRANVTLSTLRRIEGSADRAWGMPDNVDAVRAALEAAGVQFIPENGGGAGVRLRERS